MVFVYEVLNEDPPAHMGRLVAVVVWGGVFYCGGGCGLVWCGLSWFGVVWFIVMVAMVW